MYFTILTFESLLFCINISLNKMSNIFIIITKDNIKILLKISKDNELLIDNNIRRLDYWHFTFLFRTSYICLKVRRNFHLNSFTLDSCIYSFYADDIIRHMTDFYFCAGDEILYRDLKKNLLFLLASLIDLHFHSFQVIFYFNL